MKTISFENYKTHKTELTEHIGMFIFEKCGNCGLHFVVHNYNVLSDDDISCNDYLVKNIIE